MTPTEDLPAGAGAADEAQTGEEGPEVEPVAEAQPVAPVRRRRRAASRPAGPPVVAAASVG